MAIDERTFDFLDAIIHKDYKQAERIAMDIEQGEQISLFEVNECEIFQNN